jgi:succinate dehydrogenase / fumarate reductase, iron-sulfur subunit
VDVTLRIKRYNPETDVKPVFKEYPIAVEPMDRVLDALNTIKWTIDGTLTYRRSCAHGVCGSDAMRINGRNRLACKVLMKELGKKITIEPLLAFPVIKDLVVDMEPFFAGYRSIKPYLIAEAAPAYGERRQSPAERARIDDTSKCILCAACTSSCPITWPDTGYVCPAAIVNAHRFIFDSRDEGAAERLDILNEVDGVWRCRTTFNCTDACPRGIEVTKAIQEVKRALMFTR